MRFYFNRTDWQRSFVIDTIPSDEVFNCIRVFNSNNVFLQKSAPIVLLCQSDEPK